MPDFAGATPITVLKQWYAVLHSKDSKRTTTIDPKYLPIAGLTTVMLDTWASAIGGLSNSGLTEYGGLGIAKKISIPSALVYDELYGNSRSLVLVFQKKDTLAVARFNVPAPDAGLFIGRYTLRPADDAEQGARITAAIAAYLTPMNTGLAAALQWEYVHGYLDNAPAEVKELTIADEQIEEPPAGTPSEEPGE
jgi:hypothetical protein